MSTPRELVAQMTLEEKASLLSGADFWHTRSVDRLGIRAVMVTAALMNTAVIRTAM